MTLPFFLPFAWLALVAGLLLVWRRPLLALWREPVFKAPILIVESDDWGAGPLEQARALTAIVDCLARHRDAEGRAPVMTVAVVLALPEPGNSGRACRLDAPEFAPVMSALRDGIARGVLVPQLHGMTHYWPSALARAALIQPEVAEWLKAPELTERLPSPLQSRWVDASSCPSSPLEDAAIRSAVTEETRFYSALFGCAPEVVVPPTFIWNDSVEAAWVAQGVRVIVTPGHRLTSRDEAGRPAGVDRVMRNGERGEGDALYLVRDDYFEPMLGHAPSRALDALTRKTALGRPCLLETHRANFLVATGGEPDSALAALDELFSRALRDVPTLRFASSAELGRALRHGDAHWIERDRRRRFTIWLRRVAGLPRFGKAARLAGLLPLLNLFARPDTRP